jgi:hypothetical protein
VKLHTFQCGVCKTKRREEIVSCCAPSVLSKEKVPICCGKPMMEMMDD